MRGKADRPEVQRRGSGFTLVELVLVLAIIGLALGIAVPRLVRPAGVTELRLAARTTASLVRFTRNSAVSRGLRHRLVYDRGERSFRVEVEEDPFESPEEFREQRLPAGLGDGIRSPEIEIEIMFPEVDASAQDFEPDTLVFLPDGSTRDTFIYLRDSKRRAQTVAIVGPTGACAVAEGEIDDVFAEGV